jgi:hypothetical protein
VLRPEGSNLRFVTFIDDASHPKNFDYNVPERRDLDLFLEVQGLRAGMVSLDRHIENIGRRKKDAENAFWYIVSMADYQRKHALVPISNP